MNAIAVPNFAVITVIDNQCEDNVTMFLDIDNAGDYFVTPNFPTKLIFSYVDRAKSKLLEIYSRSAETTTLSDGTRKPLPDICGILNLSNAKTFSSRTLTVMSIGLTPAATPMDIDGKIEKPTGYIYD